MPKHTSELRIVLQKSCKVPSPEIVPPICALTSSLISAILSSNSLVKSSNLFSESSSSNSPFSPSDENAPEREEPADEALEDTDACEPEEDNKPEIHFK